MHRIAVGLADPETLCVHLARSSAFLVLEVQDGRVVARTLRPRDTDACGRHASFVELLDGCRAVLCGGIGQGAADALSAHGIQPIVVAGKHSPEDAARLFLSGELVTTDERVCLCH